STRTLYLRREKRQRSKNKLQKPCEEHWARKQYARLKAAKRERNEIRGRLKVDLVSRGMKRRTRCGLPDRKNWNCRSGDCWKRLNILVGCQNPSRKLLAQLNRRSSRLAMGCLVLLHWLRCRDAVRTALGIHLRQRKLLPLQSLVWAHTTAMKT
ncbi:MAG: hypothetical protein M1823_008628, partial [Watsoniomyces obsoletus]